LLASNQKVGSSNLSGRATLNSNILCLSSPKQPFFHNGGAASLEQVVNFYNQRFQMNLNDQQKTELVAFLKSLLESADRLYISTGNKTNAGVAVEWAPLISISRVLSTSPLPTFDFSGSSRLICPMQRSYNPP
jgi:hypothetical protein